MKRLRVLYIVNDDRAIGGAMLSLENLLHAVSGFVDARIIVREEDVASRYLRDRGLSVLVIPFQRATFNGSVFKRVSRFFLHWLHIIADRLLFIRKVRLTLGDWMPDIVHSNSGTVNVGLYLAKSLGVPHVWHLREYMGLDFNQHPFPCWAVWRKELDESDSVIAVSSGIYYHLHLERHPGSLWINDAVRPAAFRQLIIPKKKYFVFCASFFSAAKMPEVAVNAFRDSGVWRDGFRLCMVGNCPLALQLELRELAKEAASFLDFPGFSPDIREHMLHASAFLMTSRCEGLGRVTIEAMFCGCPVIARRSGGTLDILEDGKTGFLFDTTDQCASLIAAISVNAPVDIMERAAERAVALFSEESYGEKIMDVYSRLCRK